MTPSSPSALRQDWIERAVVEFRTVFAPHAVVPDNVRVSIGFPKGSHGGKKAIGQCWSAKASTDGHHEIFISPELSKAHDVLTTIAHELVHATVGCECGHKGAFKKLATQIGFLAPMTCTPAGPDMIAACSTIATKLGDYPAGALLTNTRKKQTTRLLKCECETCGYTVRVTRKWVEDAGTPICPTDQTSMACDAIDDEDAEDGDDNDGED
jgi:hypothetical protein